ncbi:hypothetical protein ACMBCN_01660 [Candidatus Liberibacter asiaticus]|nr:hypothetical protein [Candidatus Liberibacter asiaticus]
MASWPVQGFPSRHFQLPLLFNQRQLKSSDQLGQLFVCLFVCLFVYLFRSRRRLKSIGFYRVAPAINNLVRMLIKQVHLRLQSVCQLIDQRRRQLSS